MHKHTSIVGVLALIAALSNASAAQSPATPAPFWQQIGDSTLTRLVAEALHDGTSIHIAEARLDAARGSRTLSAFDLAPTVTASGSALRTRQSMAQVPGLTSPLPQRDLYDVGFDAAWEAGDSAASNLGTVSDADAYVPALQTLAAACRGCHKKYVMPQ